ncbi:hypothetical protein [Streptomyces sp. Z26]|uniref:hypothetical protein n=1 Tax=Streptomyces sp. Z26 TaxID=2500177 RepID=UPI000FCC915A|nr:hypothetical protein [Streptomyces sp. Z26]
MTRRNVLGSLLALLGAALAVWSPFLDWYGGREGRDFRVGELFTSDGVSGVDATLLRGLFLPMAVAAVVALVGVLLRSILLLGLAGLAVLAFTVLWMVRQGQAAGSIAVGEGPSLGAGVALAFCGGLVLLGGALGVRGRRRRRGRHRVADDNGSGVREGRTARGVRGPAGVTAGTEAARGAGERTESAPVTAPYPEARGPAEGADVREAGAGTGAGPRRDAPPPAADRTDAEGPAATEHVVEPGDGVGFRDDTAAATTEPEREAEPEPEPEAEREPQPAAGGTRLRAAEAAEPDEPDEPDGQADDAGAYPAGEDDDRGGRRETLPRRLLHRMHRGHHDHRDAA